MKNGSHAQPIDLNKLKNKTVTPQIALVACVARYSTGTQTILDKQTNRLGSAWHENGLVWPNKTSGIMEKIYSIKPRILEIKEYLPKGLHAHSLRHSFVSLLISNGLDVVNVAAGDMIEIISKHYAHSFASQRSAAMDIVGNSFAQLGNNNNTPKLLGIN